jgi:hypothetical protein
VAHPGMTRPKALGFAFAASYIIVVEEAHEPSRSP